jgi:hypothetical protein
MPERRWARALVLALLVSAGCPAGEPVLRVRGIVVDRAARPVPDVSVALQAEGRQPHTALTDKDGAFQTSMVGAARGKVSFAKDGYRPTETAVDANAGDLRIVLQPN